MANTAQECRIEQRELRADQAPRGGRPASIMEKYKHRLMMADYKDEKRRSRIQPYPKSALLGRWQNRFPACHRALRNIPRTNLCMK